GVNGFTINGAGFAVSSAGDFNGDGVDDILIGGAFTSPLTDNRFESASYIVYGHGGDFSASIDLANLDGIEGFSINSLPSNPADWLTDSTLGFSVSAAGDVNGDGLDDVILGSPNAQRNAGYGAVIFGQVTIAGTDCNDTLYGTQEDDRIFGSGGNDTLFGGEGVNTMGGGDGDDLIYGGSGADYIDGGNGSDRIFAAGGNNTVSGGAGDDFIYTGAGDDVIYSSLGNDTIWLGGGRDVIVLESGKDIDTINNFQPGNTQFAITDTALFIGLSYVQEANDTLVRITSTGEDLALLVGVQASNLIGTNPIDLNQTNIYR
ncbi:MAG: calcium-binding protein, partial [Coleofasciculaceae cyanobacterium]